MLDVEVPNVSDADIYARHAPELTRFACGLVGRVDAADVVSGAVVKALGSPSWRSVANHRAYLYRAVFNEASTWRRRAALRRRTEPTAVSSQLWEMPTYRPEVLTAVGALSVRQRAVILLTYWADLPPVEVATYLDISEGAVRRHLARARAHLREVLDA